MTEDELIKAIQDQQDLMIDRMDGSLKEVFEKLAEDVNAIVDNLSLDPKERAKNLREMLRMKDEIANTVVNNPAYIDQVSALLNDFSVLAALSDQYVGKILDQPFNRKALYNAILKTNIELTKDALLGTGVSSNFSNAIQEVLKSNIAGVTNRSQLRKVLTKFITGSADEKPFLQRYIKQVTADSILIFNSEYIQTVSSDLGLSHYRYKGTVIEDSRPFCKARSGKVYTKAEVEGWASLGDWQGRMAGTTANTIFIYRGGYNCRHTLYPISEMRYKKEKGIK
jgi:hypothetical protein